MRHVFLFILAFLPVLAVAVELDETTRHLPLGRHMQVFEDPHGDGFIRHEELVRVLVRPTAGAPSRAAPMTKEAAEAFIHRYHAYAKHDADDKGAHHCAVDIDEFATALVATAGSTSV